MELKTKKWKDRSLLNLTLLYICTVSTMDYNPIHDNVLYVNKVTNLAHTLHWHMHEKTSNAINTLNLTSV